MSIVNDDILDVNIPAKNKSEHTLSSKLFAEVDFPPDYFHNQTTDDGNYTDENTIDDYYKIEPITGTGNLQQNQNFQLTPIIHFSLDT